MVGGVVSYMVSGLSDCWNSCYQLLRGFTLIANSVQLVYRRLIIIYLIWLHDASGLCAVYHVDDLKLKWVIDLQQSSINYNSFYSSSTSIGSFLLLLLLVLSLLAFLLSYSSKSIVLTLLTIAIT